MSFTPFLHVLRLVSSSDGKNAPILDAFLSTFHFPVLPAFSHLSNKVLEIKITSFRFTYRISIIWFLCDGNRANLSSSEKCENEDFPPTSKWP